MDVIDNIIGSMAAYVGATVDGVAAALYPPPNRIEESQIPAAVFFWGGEGDSTITYNPGADQMWNIPVKAQVLVPATGDAPQLFTTVNSLLIPIVDAFAPWGDGRAPGMRLGPHGLSSHVDRVLVDRLRTTLQVGYSGHDYYCAEAYFSVKFHRIPVVPT